MKFLNDSEAKRIGEGHGFSFQKSEDVEEIEGRAYFFSHVASGARLIFLSCDDSNKAFSIGFKTPPSDSTGVFHILEHSVLCGSEKYPVKEPFVNLLKGSMQTFLNAMTYPDKTVYPVASTNEKDLENLTRVYLDAVFNPRIYTTPQIFQQEGWHKSVGSDSTLDYSGVVYNEMKGALSDPDSILFDALCERLYPDTCYEFESGGRPSDIPNLTYEKFIETHSRHYAPNNSYISLYGDLDLDKFLGIIGEEFLTPVQAKLDSGERQAGDPNPLLKSCQTLTETVDVEMEIKPESAVYGIAFKLGEAKDVLACQQIDLLMDALMSSNVSPMKKKLLETGVADDFYTSLITPVAEPALMLACQGIKDENALEIMEKTFKEELSSMIENGLDHELIEAQINSSEFFSRQNAGKVADGVVYALEMLSGWLYDDEDALTTLRYEDIYKDMRKSLEEGGFEDVAKRLLIENKDVARVRVVPQKEAKNKTRTRISQQEAEIISKEEAELHDFQNMPDMPENLAKLPYLTRDDVDRSIKKAQVDIEKGETTKLAHRNLSTKGIDYYRVYFDLSVLDVDDLPYVSLLTSFLGKFDTEDYTAEELDFLLKKDLGAFGISYLNPENAAEKSLLTCSVSCLEGKDDIAAKLLNSVCLSTKFENVDRAAQILNQKKVAWDQAVVNSGHLYAMGRSHSHLSRKAYFAELMSGIKFKKFLDDCCEDTNASVPRIFDKCREIIEKCLVKENVTFAYTCDDTKAEKFISKIDLRHGMKGSNLDFTFMPDMNVKEAFAVKSDVTFAAAANNFKNMPGMIDYSGIWQVAQRVLSYDYLWNTVRVLGGAYGCGFKAGRSGNAAFYSYRDPNVTSTLERFNEAGAWLSNYSPSEREFDGFIVSTVAGIDSPEKPNAIFDRMNRQYFEKYSEDEREKIREEVLGASLDELHEISEAVTEVAKSACVCVIGNEDALKASGEFDEVVAL